MKDVITLSAITFFALISAAHAEGCTAWADTKGFWEVKEGAEYKVKFRVSSKDCKEYNCTGYIRYYSRYLLGDGRAYRQDHTVPYAIKNAETFTEVVADILPGPTSQKLKVDDVQIKKVYCNIPF